MRRISYLTLLLAVSLCGCGAGSEHGTAVPGNTETTELNCIIDALNNTSAEEMEGKEEMKRIQVNAGDITIIYELNGSQAAEDLYRQLPLTLTVEPFSSNEMTFYPPEKLNIGDTPLSGGESGSLSYYKPWGDVVMFYAPCPPNGGLYSLGTAVSGAEEISRLSGTIEITAAE